ncbi:MULTISPECIES: baseplate J/gp47 family protein [unclassified Halomonas]|uniref:baseplate assembly protein n=1 Tax=unclassified Halomonas TaxID=2609666 RepID=UPI0028841A67|nr:MULTISPECIES: baseplate J/gp47 family protein [unclassified Halomonas]MDT0501908.1 baseplate J/gp47 family protein [Halomonas sp. PAR7]MDT0511003.1 baseplate J/gp47 family protein [Halomonas sp. LES1]MDT0592480.1 baseplate J/gp47 family protein [Halomonas sp. PAR8]
MAGGYTAVDLSQLPAPVVVEGLDYETVLAERKAALLELVSVEQRSAVEAVLELESEPLTKLLEESAYRELLLRQRVNEAATAVMLAYARDSDLDQIGANYQVERLVIDEGDPDAVPPVSPTFESDADFRRRIQLSPEGYTTAGSKGSYEFHALGADAQVRDAQAITPAPGQVTVYVLSREANGAASPELQASVAETLNAEQIRPMTDQVTVQSAAITEYTVDATLTVFSGPDAMLVRQAAIDAVTTYAVEQHRLGYDITLSGLYAALHQEGVQNVTLASPSADLVIGDGEAAYCTDVTVTLGGTGV